jgi:NitT/TauT family transport system permease protein
MQSRNRSIPRWAWTLIGAAFWLVLWAVVAAILEYNIGKVRAEAMFPSPFAVCKSYFTMLTMRKFYQAVFSSLLRITIGFTVGAFVGVATAISMHNLKVCHGLFTPILLIIRATPVASFILIVRIWLERGHIPSFIAALMVLPLVCANTKAALSELDPAIKEMTKMYRISFPKRLRYFYLPSVLPYFSASAVTAFGLAWKAGIAAEVLFPPDHSLGRVMNDAKAYLETADLFAYTLTVILCSFACEKLLAFLLSLFSHRKKKQKGEIV